MKRTRAQRRYEEAVEKGDSAALLSIDDEGLATATFANILPGEEIALEVEIVQAVRAVESSVRIVFPTVIADKYGTYPGLRSRPWSEPFTSALADYPASITVRLCGDLAGANISMPSHPGCRMRMLPSEAAVEITVDKARLDRDVVVRIDGLAPCSYAANFALQPHEDVMLARLDDAAGVRPSSESKPLRLAVLADCSGSMDGLSIALLRKALSRLPAIFRVGDEVTLIAFGSQCEVRLKKQKITAETRGSFDQAWARAVSRLEADLGGTEVGAAFEYAAMQWPCSQEGLSILLATDGQVWNIADLKDQLAATHARVSALGIGVAPGRTLLEELSRFTGGVCTGVLPVEDPTQSVEHLVRSLRGASETQPAVRWNVSGRDFGEMAGRLIADESMVFAGILKGLPKTERGELRSIVVNGRRVEFKRVELSEPRRRLAARWAAYCDLVAGRNGVSMGQEDEEAFETYAVHWNLLTERTALLLTKQRSEDQKGSDMPVLVRIAQMPACESVDVRAEELFFSARRECSPDVTRMSFAPYACVSVKPDTSSSGVRFEAGRREELFGVYRRIVQAQVQKDADPTFKADLRELFADCWNGTLGRMIVDGDFAGFEDVPEARSVEYLRHCPADFRFLLFAQWLVEVFANAPQELGFADGSASSTACLEFVRRIKQDGALELDDEAAGLLGLTKRQLREEFEKMLEAAAAA